jgi:hypothetical protein
MDLMDLSAWKLQVLVGALPLPLPYRLPTVAEPAPAGRLVEPLVLL